MMSTMRRGALVATANLKPGRNSFRNSGSPRITGTPRRSVSMTIASRASSSACGGSVSPSSSANNRTDSSGERPIIRPSVSSFTVLPYRAAICRPAAQ
jgi:hypothetical protein